MEFQLRQNATERVFENIAKCSFLLLIVLSSWLCSGTRVEFIMPMFFTAGASFVFCVLASLYKQSNGYRNMLSIALVFFVIVCTVAYFNPFLEFFAGEYCKATKRLEYVEWLPTSVRATFDNGNSLRSLCVLSTSLFATMSACALFNRRNFAIISLVWFAINSTLMGAFAIYQKFDNATALYGIFHSPSDFYGSFFLSNAAGAFLNMGVAASVASVAIFASRRSYFFATLFFFLALISSFGAWYSQSKAAQLLCLVQWGIFAYLAIFIFIRQNIKSAIIRICAILTVLIAMVAAGYGTYNIYSIKHKEKDTITTSVGSRMRIYEYTFENIKKYPIWGIGGECSRYILTKNIPTKKGFYTIAEEPHSDILEYILEYGLVGSIVFAMAGIFFCKELFTRRKLMSISNYCILTGTAICFLHGAFDMEFHIPSTMIAFGIMTAWSYVDFKK